MSTDLRKERTCNRLKDAMTILLHQKSFDQIMTKELVTTAGISRSSFYTHYQDKYDMIESLQTALFNTIEYIFEKSDADLYATFLETYAFIDKNPIYAALLSENGSKEIHQFMLQSLKKLLGRIYEKTSSRRSQLGQLGNVYASTYYACAIFGATQAWIQRKRKETPSQMAALLIGLLGISQ